ncbi:hypothetical protein NQ314_010290, partial [Rhamnusium bicolor]
VISTRMFTLSLCLLSVQPSAPRIFDTEGREVKLNSPAGPFLEGHELFLSCQVTGGNPKPSLTWWYNGTILDGVIDSSRASFTTVNQLIINNTPRHFKGARFECRASSSENAGDIIREVPLTIFCKYISNKIKANTEEETDTFTGSILSLNVVAEDDGKDLVCRAHNPRFPGGSAEDRRQIHVACK